MYYSACIGSVAVVGLVVCQCSNCYWSVMFGLYEIVVARGGSQCDSSPIVSSPVVTVSGSGIYFRIVVVNVCFPCSFAAVVRVPVP